MKISGDVSLDFYGLPIWVKADDKSVSEDLYHDFSYFEAAPVNHSAVLEVISHSGPRDRLLKLKCALHTPVHIVYRDGDLSYVDYFGRALAIVCVATYCSTPVEDRLV